MKQHIPDTVRTRRTATLVYSPDDGGYYWTRHNGLTDETSVAIYSTREEAQLNLRENRVAWES